MTFLTLLVLGLATWRISSLFVEESGPFHIFTKIRKLTGIQHDSNEKILVIPGNFFAEVFSCVWCFSIYVGCALFTLWYYFPLVTFGFACILALSTIAIFIKKSVS